MLVERAELTSGSTFHSAGLVGQLRGSLSLTKMMMASVELYRVLEAEVGLETGWREVGSLRLASSQERQEEIARQAGWAKTFGLPLELISPDEAAELFPPMPTDGVVGAAYLPTDGYVDPSQLTLALAEGARRRGAEIEQHTRVTGIRVRRGRVEAVETDQGEIETDVVVNAGGMYAREIGALAGVDVPIVPMAHEYLVTRPAGLALDLPTMRDPSLLVYFRPESGGLVMGGYERHCAPWGLDGIPSDFNSRLLEEDWPRFEELLENAVVRVPSLAEMEVVRLINGPEAFTPDGEFVLGPSDVGGFWVAAGFCAHGLAGAGGMGRLVAEWIVEGTPSLDVWEMDSRRFGSAYRSPGYTLARTKEVYETYYDVKYPGHERSAGRPLRVSPAYPRLQALGAAFGEKSGWERANWFEPNAEHGDESLRPSRLGRSALVAGDRGRARRLPRGGGALRRVLVREDRGVGRGCCRLPRAALRQPRRARGRPDHLHADAQLPRRNRVRLHGDAARRRSLSDRHGNRVRPPRPRLDPPRRAGRRLRSGLGRHVVARLLRPLGPAREGDPAAVDRCRPRQRCVSLHDGAGAGGGAGAVRRAPRHIRRRARLGALLLDRARPRAVGRALGGGPSARARRGRIQGDRLPAAREGLPRLGRRHHAGRDALRGGAGVCREARQGRLRRAGGVARGDRAGAPAPVSRARGSALGRARLGARARARRRRGACHERRFRLHGRPLDRLRVPALGARSGHGGRGRDLRRLGRGEVAIEPLHDPEGERIRA